VEDAKLDFAKVSDICKAEIQAFELMKMKDFKQIFVKYVQLNMDIELQTVNQWKQLLEHLSN
jgi:hypothetical protein